MSTSSEVKKYKKILKDQENQIKNLVKSNKHIREHIKFLEGQLEDEPEQFPEAEQIDNGKESEENNEQ